MRISARKKNNNKQTKLAFLAVFLFLLFFVHPAFVAAGNEGGLLTREDLCGGDPSTSLGVASGIGSRGRPLQDGVDPDKSVKLSIVIPGITDQCGWIRDVNNDKKGNLVDYIVSAYTFLVGAAAFLAVIMIMYGGFIWIFAGGSSTIITKGRDTIKSAIIGLILALVSVSLLQQINPKLADIYLEGISGVAPFFAKQMRDMCPYNADGFVLFISAESTEGKILDEILYGVNEETGKDTYTGGKVYLVPSAQKEDTPFPMLKKVFGGYVERSDAGYYYPALNMPNQSQYEETIASWDNSLKQECGFTFMPLKNGEDKLTVAAALNACGGYACDLGTGQEGPDEESINQPEGDQDKIQICSFSGQMPKCELAKTVCESAGYQNCEMADVAVYNKYSGTRVSCSRQFDRNDGILEKYKDKCAYGFPVECPLLSSPVTDLSAILQLDSDCIDIGQGDGAKPKTRGNITSNGKGYVGFKSEDNFVGVCCQKQQGLKVLFEGKELAGSYFARGNKFYNLITLKSVNPNIFGTQFLGNVCQGKGVGDKCGVDVKSGLSFSTGTCQKRTVKVKEGSFLLEYDSLLVCNNDEKYKLCYASLNHEIFFRTSNDLYESYSGCKDKDFCIPMYVENSADCKQ